MGVDVTAVAIVAMVADSVVGDQEHVVLGEAGIAVLERVLQFTVLHLDTTLCRYVRNNVNHLTTTSS